MIVVGLITLFLVAGIVALHVQSLLLISDHLPRFPFRHLFKVSLGLIGVIATHVFSIILFGGTMWGLNQIDGNPFGEVISESGEGGAQSLHDFIYFSFTTYTTVGYGDYFPVGPLRLISQIEALMGLVLIACSASYVFVIMQDYWKTHTRRPKFKPRFKGRGRGAISGKPRRKDAPQNRAAQKRQP